MTCKVVCQKGIRSPDKAFLILTVGTAFVLNPHQIRAAITPPITTEIKRSIGNVLIGAGIFAVSS